MIEPGQIYQHFKGGRYMIVSLANIESTKEPVVVYSSLTPDEYNNVRTWVRPLREFQDRVELPHGSGGTKIVNRFELVGEPCF